jgi:hypothetical protein
MASQPFRSKSTNRPGKAIGVNGKETFVSDSRYPGLAEYYKRNQRTAKDAAIIASTEFWDKIMAPPNSQFAEEHFDPSQLKERNLPVSLRDPIVP